MSERISHNDLVGAVLGPSADPRAVVRELFDAYRTQDETAARRLVADGFVFTSPQDDHIDRAAWFERCFPTADRFVRHETLAVVDTGDRGVLVLYEYELADGSRYRNTERVDVRDGTVVAVEVFFGGRVG